MPLRPAVNPPKPVVVHTDREGKLQHSCDMDENNLDYIADAKRRAQRWIRASKQDDTALRAATSLPTSREPGRKGTVSIRLRCHRRLWHALGDA